MTRVVRLLAPVAIAIVLLLGLEGACRAVGRLRTGQWPVTRAEAHRRFVETVATAYRPHPYLVVSGRPGATLDVAGHRVRFNSLGMRGAEPAAAKGALRILCAGGSTTFDLLAANDDATWPARLGRKLDREVARVEVLNAGFPGWTTLESLVSLSVRDVDLAPDLVVVHAGVNDLQPAAHVPFARDYALGHGELLPRVLGVERVPLSLASRSVLAEGLLDRLAPASANGPQGFSPAWGWAGARRDEPPAAAVDVFVRNLRSIAAIARAHGARTILVAQAVRLRKGSEARDGEYLESWTPGLTAKGFVTGLERFNAAAKALAEQDGLGFVDPFEGGGFVDADYGDAMHVSDSGSERLASVLASALATTLTSPAPSPGSAPPGPR